MGVSDLAASMGCKTNQSQTRHHQRVHFRLGDGAYIQENRATKATRPVAGTIACIGGAEAWKHRADIDVGIAAGGGYTVSIKVTVCNTAAARVYIEQAMTGGVGKAGTDIRSGADESIAAPDVVTR